MNDSALRLPLLGRVGLRRFWIGAAIPALAVALASCARQTEPLTQPSARTHLAGDPIILVSFDGFRWDYPDRGLSSNLAELERRGVRAEALVPSFPSKTFPNHYTLVTGLVPDHHGIVANTMWDPEFEALFSLSLRDEVADARWWGGEPVWVVAERSGLPTAPLFWPGSEAPIGGYRPSYWLPFDGAVPYPDRVDWVLGHLDRPVAERPVFLSLSFSLTDDAGHRYGPVSPETDEAIRIVDAALGRLLDGLRDRGLEDEVNVVVVSDHGMIETSQDRVVFIDDYVDLDVAGVVDWNPVLALWPDEANRDAVYDALKNAHPHLAVYRRTEIPPHLMYGTHRRTPPILGVASPGWTISNHPYFDEAPERADGGNHGYDPAATGMHGVFIAAGPSFRRGVRVPAFRNVHVYPLLMEVLGLPAAVGDGDLAVVAGMLSN